MTVRTLVVLLVVAVGAGCAQPGSREGEDRARRIEARVTAVTDGDTLRVRATGSGRDYDVRLIGLDTPRPSARTPPWSAGAPGRARAWPALRCPAGAARR